MLCRVSMLALSACMSPAPKSSIERGYTDCRARLHGLQKRPLLAAWGDVCGELGRAETCINSSFS